MSYLEASQKFRNFSFLALGLLMPFSAAAISMPKGYEFRAMAIVLPLFFILISFYDSYLWGHHTQALFAYLSAIF
jgi:hypothetical protein